jgi:hypothetical protein
MVILATISTSHHLLARVSGMVFESFGIQRAVDQDGEENESIEARPAFPFLAVRLSPFGHRHGQERGSWVEDATLQHGRLSSADAPADHLWFL